MRLEPSLLQLEGYYIRALNCAVRSELEQETKLAMATGLHIQPDALMTSAPLTVGVDIESAKNQQNEKRYRIVMRIYSDESANKRTPYIFDLTLVGYFKYESEELPDAVGDIMFIRNGAMILYSSGREIIASATGRGPFPGLVLPAFAFTVDEELTEARKDTNKVTRPAGQRATKARLSPPKRIPTKTPAKKASKKR